MPKKMTHDDYITKREWLMDTAETPAQQKRLKADLAKLQAQYKASKIVASKITSQPSGYKNPKSPGNMTAKVSPMPTTTEQQRQNKALADLMKKRKKESKRTGVWPNYNTN